MTKCWNVGNSIEQCDDFMYLDELSIFQHFYVYKFGAQHRILVA